MKAISLLAVLATIFFALPAAGQNVSERCGSVALPADIRRQLQVRFPLWKIQEPKDLSLDALKTWQGAKPISCPGISTGQFVSADQVAYAVLLVPQKDPNGGFRLVIFRPAEAAKFDLTTIDRSDHPGAANYFIHSTAIAKYFSVDWINKLFVKAKEGVLFVDSGKEEFQADVYFWAGDRWSHEPVDY